MKIAHHTLIAVLALSSLPLVGSAQALIFDGFETYTPGSAIGGQGDWTAPSVAGAVMEVSTTVAYEGSNSLMVSDNATTSGGRAILNIVPTLQQGILSFAVMEDQSDAVRDDWTVVLNDFAGISLSTWGNSLYFKKYGAGYTTEFNLGKTFAEIGYETTDWNYFAIDFDNEAKGATIYLNDVAIFTSTNISTSDWSLYDAYFQSGTNAGTGDVVYYDSIKLETAAVPEPATYAVMLGIIGFAFSLIKRRRARLAIV